MHSAIDSQHSDLRRCNEESAYYAGRRCRSYRPPSLLCGGGALKSANEARW
jgi:hypothetical protein